MVKQILFAATQNSKGQCEDFFDSANFHVKTEPDDITARFLEAWHRLERKEGGRVNLSRFGGLLGPEMSGTAVPASTIGRWEKGSVPDLVSVAAIAKLCGVHPAWLAFGLGSPDDLVVGEIVIKREKPPKPERRGAVKIPEKPALGTGKKTATGKGRLR